MLSVYVGIAFQCESTTYGTVTKKKEKTIRKKFETNAYQVSCPLSLPRCNKSSCQSMLKYMSLYVKLCIFTCQLYDQI